MGSLESAFGVKQTASVRVITADRPEIGDNLQQC
jgi:hypothetical protein